ncbi:MAG: ArnT family glycosyltransferase [Anaerolineae bacterium]
MATVYSILNPLFESPDEVWHYAFVQHLASGQALPVLDPLHPGPWEQEGGQPPLYYLVVSLFTRLLPPSDWQQTLQPNRLADIGHYLPDGNGNAFIHTPAEAWPYHGAALAIHLARLISILLGACTILFTYLIGREFWPQRPWLALAGAALLAFTPMFLFISASVSNDNLIILTSTLACWLMLRLLRQPPTPLRFLILGVVIGMAALSKISGIALLAPAGLLLVWLAWQRRDLRLLLWGGVYVFVAVLVVAGWWYLRNWQLYGDPLGLKVFVAVIGPRQPRITLWQLTQEWQGLVRSYWGVFGWMNVVAPSWFYYLLNGLALLGIAGLVVQFVKRLYQHRWPSPLAMARVALLVIWPLVVFVSLVRWTMITPATQGRLLFPTAFALVLLLVYGLSSLVPRRWEGIPLVLSGTLIAGLAVWVPLAVIKPAYDPPRPLGLHEAQVPNALTLQFEGQIELLGYQVETDTVQPGEDLAVILYWRAIAPTAKKLSAFVQLVDASGEVIAYRNKPLGGASFSTPYWPSGTVIAEKYLVPVTLTALNPSQLELKVGLFQPQDADYRLQIQDAAGQALGDSVRLQMIKVKANPQGEINNTLDYNLANEFRLLGYNLERDVLKPGDTVQVSLFWKASRPIPLNYTVFVQVIDVDNKVWGQLHAQPQGGAAPTRSWQPGQLIRDSYSFILSADTPPGSYRLDLGVYPPDTGTNLRVIADDGTPGDNHIILYRLRVEAP